MPKAFSDQEKEFIRLKLLDQGYKLFSAHGLRKVNVEELAEAAAISKGAFYIFYESKEALFMDVVEKVEKRYRREIMAMVELPGPSPRSRLFAVLKKSLTIWRSIPLLRFFATADYELLVRKMPADRLQEHLASDEVFIRELIAYCRTSGIPVQISANQFRNLSYSLLLIVLHGDDFGTGNLDETLDLLLDLVSAYCLGEIQTLAK